MLNESMNGSMQNQKQKWTYLSPSPSPSQARPNGTFARPNSGILKVNLLLDDGFNLVVVVCPSGGFFRATNVTVCWGCRAGGVVGSDGTLPYTEDGGVLLSEREAVYTGGRSIISGVGDGLRSGTASRLAGYVGRE